MAVALDAPVETLEDERTFQPEVLDTRGAVLALPEAERGDTDVAVLPAPTGAFVGAGPGVELVIFGAALKDIVAAAKRLPEAADRHVVADLLHQDRDAANRHRKFLVQRHVAA